VILCHARREVQLPKWTLRTGKSWVEFGLDAEWLSRHPLTQHLLEEEADQWDKVGIRFALKPL
jgi:exopolyphosphatase/guanosine-5'-triphosphate,3'-diphosphate pyrophosphatase